jgi:hypothetical protein
MEEIRPRNAFTYNPLFFCNVFLKGNFFVGLEVLTAVAIKNIVFCDVIP